MREIKYIVVHCSDTPKNTTVESILRFWKIHWKWKAPGYHYIIQQDGEVVQLLDEELISNGVLGFNKNCINVCYIGGRKKDGKCGDTRTPAQQNALFDKIVELTEKYPHAQVREHGSFPNQGGRTCPNFNLKEWLATYKPKIDPI